MKCDDSVDRSTDITNTTRAFFAFKGRRRLVMDIAEGQLVGEVKEKVRRALRLDADEGTVGSESHRRKNLSLSFSGAVLNDSWRFSDLGIPSGAQALLSFCRVLRAGD